jgi:ABC-type nitrate/sulfonate/bicarbonate transport system permease component
VLLVQAAILCGVTAIWIASTEGQWVSPIMVAGPVAIASAIREGLAQGELVRALGVTALEVLVAVLIGCTAGLAVGLAGGLWRQGHRALYPVLIALSSIPVFILYPLFVIWFGMGPPSKYAFGAVYAFFPVALNAFAAVRGVDRQLLVKARSLGARPLQVYMKVVVPASLPTVVVGLRLGVSYAFVGIVATEMISSFNGIGYLLSYYALLFQSGKTYGYILVALLFAFALNTSLRVLERRAGRWR